MNNNSDGDFAFYDQCHVKVSDLRVSMTHPESFVENVSFCIGIEEKYFTNLHISSQAAKKAFFPILSTTTMLRSVIFLVEASIWWNQK